MKKIVLIAAALLSMQATAAAANDIKPYAGVGLGLFELDPGQNKKAVFGGFGFVGASLHEYFAAEFRAGLTGPHEREELGPLTETFQVNWFVSALAKPKIEAADGLEFYGLLGATSISTSITPLNSTIERSVTKTALTFGLGGTYFITDNMSVGVEWVRYSSNANAATKNGASFNGLDVNGFTGTFAYHF